MAERFCYVTLIPDGSGKVMLAVHNPLSVVIHDVWIAMSGYGRLLAMKSKRIDGQIVFSKIDHDSSLIVNIPHIDVKPGVHIISNAHLALRSNNTDIPTDHIAAFEIHFWGPKNEYVEQLGADISEDHLSSLNAYKLFKIDKHQDGFYYKLIDGEIPRSFERFDAMFKLPIIRLYLKGF